MTDTTDRGSRFARLPLWAQREITALEARVQRETDKREAAEAAAKGVLDASNAVVWLNPYDATPTPVTGRGESVRFALTDDGKPSHSWDWIDVRVNRHKPCIEVHAGRGIRVRPLSGNLVEIELEAF